MDISGSVPVRLEEVGRGHTASAELHEDITSQLHVVLGKVQRPLGTVLVKTFVDQLIHMWVSDACEDIGQSCCVLLARRQWRHITSVSQFTKHIYSVSQKKNQATLIFN